MATNYPGSLDSGTQQPSPSASTEMAGSGFEHDVVHTNHSGAIIALETKVGTGDSNAVANSVLAGTGSGTSGWTTGTLANAISGNAATATALATARAINGVDFDGSAAITVTAAAGTLTGGTLNSGVTASSLTSVGTLSALTVNVGTENTVILAESTDATARINMKDNSTSGSSYVGIGAVGDDMSLWAGNSKRITAKSDGKVGIGTTSPSKELDVHGASNPEVRILSTDASDPSLVFGDSVDGARASIYYDTSANDLLFRGYNNATRMTIDSAGNVGIGTTSPDTNLEVVGSVRASTSFLVNSSGDDGIGPVTGSFGSVQTVGTGTGSYEGYSINGQQVFMGNGTEICGIYNDVDNQWLLFFDADTHTQLYDSDGIVAFGANNYTSGGTGSGGNGYVGISNYCGGFSGTTAVITSTTVAGVAMKRLGFSTSSYEFKTGIEDLAMSDEAFMSLKPITYHPNDQYVDSTGDVTEIVGGHTIVPDSVEAGETAGLLPLKRAGFGLEDLYGREDTMILATEFAPDSNALIALLTLKLQETMTRVATLETV